MTKTATVAAKDVKKLSEAVSVSPERLTAAGFRVRNQEFQDIPSEKLVAHPKNFRVHPNSQKDAIQKVLREVGFVGTLLVRRMPGGMYQILDGHCRQLQFAKGETVPCNVIDCDDSEAAEIIATYDRLTNMADIDPDILRSLLDDCTFDVPGIDDICAEMLAEALASIEGDADESPPPAIVEDEIPDAPTATITQPGDLWLLGDHRLLCGDSRSKADVSRLINAAVINLAFTSPPYASQRKYDETSGFKPIHPDKYVEWFEAVQANVKAHLAEDGSWFVNIKPPADGLDTHLYVHDLVAAHVRQWGWHFATEFCWERTGVPKSVTRRFKNQFEPIYQFSIAEWKMRPDAVRHKSNDVPMSLGKGSGNTSWSDKQGSGGVIPSNRRPRRQGKSSTRSLREMQGTGADCGDVVVSGWAYPGNRLPTFTGTHEATGHTAAFPVGLPAFFIQAYTDEGDRIYEPFCGSGTTIIAAEQLGRRCFGMEISPAYCDVIVKRWEKFTGKTAERSDQ